MNLAAPPPETEQSNVTALILSALVHLLLLGALFLGVQWKSQSPSSVEVEVWRAPPPAPMVSPEPQPEVKPEPKPEPKPVPKVEPTPPVKPDIAIKDDKKKKEEPKKPEPKKEEPKKPEPKKPEPKPEPKREVPDFQKQLEQEQKQIQQQKVIDDQRARATSEAAAEANQRAQLKADQASAARARGLAGYVAKISGKIRGNIVLPAAIRGNPEAVFKVTQLPSGEVLNVKISKSSGNKSLDEAIERAILKSSPLPKPDQPELFQRDLELKYKPFDE